MAAKAGWEYVNGPSDESNPNAMVRNTSTGQLVTSSHPTYLNAAAPAQAIDNGPVGTSVNAPITNPNQVQNTPGTVGGTTAQGAPTTVAQSFQQQLINRLNPGPVSASDPSVAPAIEANKLAEQRNMESGRNLLAERAAKGGYGGNFETGLTGLAQDRAAREGQFAGQAVQHASDLQNQNILAALGLSSNLLTGNANRDQASELAHMGDATQRYGIDTQGNLGAQDIALRGELGRNANNLSLLGLLQNNDQFGRSLAQNGAQFGAGLDQQGLLSLLGLI